ncbi:MAG: DUF4157 domain-containing protein, partial [Nannocystaceae bacterium]|nr:DUF4157 domain-containing protein [Nannocystaceae bacterium]
MKEYLSRKPASAGPSKRPEPTKARPHAPHVAAVSSGSVLDYFTEFGGSAKAGEAALPSERAEPDEQGADTTADEASRVGSRRKSLLRRLRKRPPLADAWAAATSGASSPLPGRRELERRFNTSLDDVEVHTGPEVTTLLDSLDARGAARGNQVLVSNLSDADTVAHEVAHTLQARAGGQGGGVLPSTHAAEREAE